MTVERRTVLYPDLLVDTGGRGKFVRVGSFSPYDLPDEPEEMGDVIRLTVFGDPGVTRFLESHKGKRLGWQILFCDVGNGRDAEAFSGLLEAVGEPEDRQGSEMVSVEIRDFTGLAS